MSKPLKVALLHDHLNQAGGAERVLYALKNLFPDAPIYTVFYDKKRLKGFEKFDVRTTFIQKIPGGVRHFKWFLPIMPAAIEQFDLSKFDVVISSCSALIKGAITGPNTVHICYCHTPTRYLWADSSEYAREVNAPKFIKKLLPLYLHKLRIWDQLAANRVDHFVANSKFIARQIDNFYRKPSTVIYPPVDTASYKPSTEIGNYYLITGRLRPYKKVDVAIKAFNKLGIPLKVIGTGDQEDYLKSIAKSNIEFLGAVDEETKREVMSKCIAYISPQVEDFGIVTVEAMAAGRPVIAYKAGGVVEQIIPGVTGEFFEDQTWESLLDTVLHFDPKKYDGQKIHEHAQQFSVENFNQKILDFVSQVKSAE